MSRTIFTYIIYSFIFIGSAQSKWSIVTCQFKCTSKACADLTFGKQCVENCSSFIDNCKKVYSTAVAQQQSQAEEARKKALAEQQRQAEEARKKALAEQQRQAEETRKRALEEQQRQAAEAEKKKLEENARRIASTPIVGTITVNDAQMGFIPNVTFYLQPEGKKLQPVGGVAFKSSTVFQIREAHLEGSKDAEMYISYYSVMQHCGKFEPNKDYNIRSWVFYTDREMDMASYVTCNMSATERKKGTEQK